MKLKGKAYTICIKFVIDESAVIAGALYAIHMDKKPNKKNILWAIDQLLYWGGANRIEYHYEEYNETQIETARLVAQKVFPELF